MVPAVDDWVGQIVFSAAVEAKLRQRKGITADQVREAVALDAHEEDREDDDPDYGFRLILTGSCEGGRLRVYLRPLDRSDGRWECLTAWRV
jgi:hypothetical protein